MNDMTPTSAERAAKLEGMGCKRKRVEDIRFTQGKGNYVDDLKLPGMLYGDFGAFAIRPRPRQEDRHRQGRGGARRRRGDHRRDAENRQPRLDADARRRRRRWCSPTARCCSRTRKSPSSSPKTARPRPTPSSWSKSNTSSCPSTSIRSRRCRTDAPMIREDLKDKTDGAHGKRKHYNHIFSWQAGDKAATDAAFAKADVTIREMIVYPRVHPCPLETCQCVASFDKIKGELTLWGTFQAPHVIRTVGSLISKIPEHKIHVIAPDIGGGFGNKVGAYPGYICSIVASIVTGRAGEMGRGPHREPLHHGVRARLPHGHGNRRDQGRQGDGDALLHHRRPWRVRRLRQRHQMAGGPVQHHQRFVRFPGRALSGRRRLYQQGAGRRRLSLLVPRHRGGLLHRARHGHHGAKARHGSGRISHEEPDPARAIPVHVRVRLAVRFRRLSDRHEQGDGNGELQEAARRAEGANAKPSSAAKPAT